MNYQEISSFLAVVKVGTLSGAADTLYITHPALTHRINALEKKLGYSLFDRKAGVRNVTLTPRGKKFLALAEQWKELEKSAFELRNAEPREHFSIAAIESISSYVLMPICKQLMSLHYDLQLNIKHQYSIYTYEDLMNRTVDLGIINETQYSKELHCQSAFQENMFFVCRAGSEYPETVKPQLLDGRDSIFVPWFPDYKMWYQYWFHGENNYRIFLQNVYSLKDCLTETRSWSIVPASVANWLKLTSEFEVHAIENGPIPRINYFLTRRNYTSPYIQEVFTLLKERLSPQGGFKILF